MDIALIKILEYFGNSYSIGDIIDVTYSYIDDEEGIIGKLEDILENSIVLDASEEYSSDVIEILFEEIVNIQAF